MGLIVSLLTTLISLLVYLNTDRIANERNRWAVRAIAFLIGAIAALSSLFRTATIIPAGNVGVVDFFGQVSPNPHLAPANR